MTLWHLMFNKPAFTKGQAKHIVYTLQDAGSFGGFPLDKIGIVRDTEDLLYLDMQFRVTIGLTQDTFENMLKYLLVLSGRLDTAPLSVYFSIMQKSLDELQITYQRYEDHSLDVFFWQSPPIVAPAEDKERLRFREDEKNNE